MKSGEIDFLIGTAGVGLAEASVGPVTLESVLNVSSISLGKSEGATALLETYADTTVET
jgi:hypothetical protein